MLFLCLFSLFRSCFSKALITIRNFYTSFFIDREIVLPETDILSIRLSFFLAKAVEKILPNFSENLKLFFLKCCFIPQDNNLV